MKILMITNLLNECSIEDRWIAQSFEEDGHIVTLTNKFYDSTLDNEYDIFIKRYSWIEDIDDFEVGANESDYETRILSKNLPRINFDGKFDNQGKGYLAKLYSQGYSIVPTIDITQNIDLLGYHEKYLIKPINGYAGFGIIECNKGDISKYWTKDYVIQPKLQFDSEVQFYFIGSQFQFAQIFIPKKILSHENALFYYPSSEEIALATSFAKLNGDNFNGVQRIDFLKIGNILLLSELEDDSPYMAIEALPDDKKLEFINNYKQMVYKYYHSVRGNTRLLTK